MAIGFLSYTNPISTAYTFYNIQKINNWSLRGGQSLDTKRILSLLDPWIFDSATRDEDFSFTFLAKPSAYNSSSPGTGTFMDQLCDIMYLNRNQGSLIRTKCSLMPYFIFSIYFTPSVALNASHDSTKCSNYLTTGFEQGDHSYRMKCAIKDVSIEEMDAMQQRVAIKVDLSRTGLVIGYG